MNLLKTTIPSLEQKEAIYTLWNSEYPTRICYTSFADFEHYLSALSGQQHYFLEAQGAIIAWLFLFTRDNQNWFAIIVNSAMHGKGLGTQLLNVAKQTSASLSGWVVDNNNETKKDGTSYASPLNFYLKNGFALIPGTRLETEKISAAKIEWHKTS